MIAHSGENPIANVRAYKEAEVRPHLAAMRWAGIAPVRSVGSVGGGSVSSGQQVKNQDI